MKVPRALMSRTAALIAIGCAVLVCAAILGSAVNAVRHNIDEERSAALLQLARYQGLAAERPALERWHANLTGRIATLPGLVRGGGDALAAAQLQSAIKQLASSIGGDVRSARALSSAKEGGLAVVRLACDMTIPASRLRDLAYAIETHRPYLFVDRADITGPVAWNARDPDPTFEVDLVLRAYRWAGAK